ncbi:hypothetical protein [Algoriphagus antarcticus]|uniref:Uncharacterized protein n=1 Tax=Algoriphagus antarcticus TaxID=238540 RepID=A0A3E0DF82_9BACT|nr:hypothetical protein [Algoriphagus antarcticus]REG81237.1 hypothetical protein C8N25_12827 [Algoriphagus antarcticus]
MKNYLITIALALSATFLSFTLTAQEYKLRKVRDLHIESLANAGIRDYDPKRDIYSGFIDKGSEGVELAIFDAKGKIVVSKKRQGEGPEDYLMSALTMGFSPDGNIWVQTSMELLKYDLEFNLIDKVRFEPKNTTVVYSGPWSKFVPLTKSSQVSFITIASNLRINVHPKWVPSNINMMEFYDDASKSIQSEVF